MLLGAVAAAGNICCCWEHFGRKSSLPTFDALEIAAWAFVIEVACADRWCVGSSTARDHQKLVVAAQGELTKLGVKCWIDIDGGM